MGGAGLKSGAQNSFQTCLVMVGTHRYGPPSSAIPGTIARNQTGSKAAKTRTVAVLKDDNNTVSGFTGYATMEGLRFGFFKASQFIL